MRSSDGGGGEHKAKEPGHKPSVGLASPPLSAAVIGDEELKVTSPMFLHVRICECGRVGEYARTRCGRDGRHNMRVGCPTIVVVYVPFEDGP